MMSKCKVIIKGIGQLNGPVNIHKEVEMDQRTASTFTGPNRYDVLTDFVKTHYPGVKINPRQFGINVVPIKKQSEKKDNSSISAGSLIGGAIAGAMTNKIKGEKQASNPKGNSQPQKYKSEEKREQKKHKGSIKNLIVDSGKGLIDDLKQKSNLKREKEKYYHDKKNQIYNLTIPQTVEDIINQIDDLFLRINDEGWMIDDVHRNSYTDLCYEKVKQLIDKLKIVAPNSDCSIYDKKLKKLKWKRFFKKNFK